MKIPAKRVSTRGAVAALAVAASVIAGCGDGSTPQQPATTTTTAPAATTTAISAGVPPDNATTTAPAATTTAAPATTTTTETAAADTGTGSASLEGSVETDLGDIGADTLWRDVFDVLTAQEQSCIRESISDDMLEALLEARVQSEGTELPVAAMFACLRPETSDAIWISALITGMAQEENLELGRDERSCMREQLASLLSSEDLAGLAAQVTQDGSVVTADDVKALLTAAVVLFECVPDSFIREILSEADIDPDELSEDETSCLRELAADLDDMDWPEILAASGSEENYDLLLETIELTGMTTRATVLFECVPDSFIRWILSEADIDPDELSEDETSCLRELVTDLDDLDWPEISAASGSEENYDLLLETFFETMAAVPECLPERLLDTWKA